MSRNSRQTPGATRTTSLRRGAHPHGRIPNVFAEQAVSGRQKGPLEFVPVDRRPSPNERRLTQGGNDPEIQNGSRAKTVLCLGAHEFYTGELFGLVAQRPRPKRIRWSRKSRRYIFTS
jgi:hypothetical protein